MKFISQLSESTKTKNAIFFTSLKKTFLYFSVGENLVGIKMKWIYAFVAIILSVQADNYCRNDLNDDCKKTSLGKISCFHCNVIVVAFCRLSYHSSGRVCVVKFMRRNTLSFI